MVRRLAILLTAFVAPLAGGAFAFAATTSSTCSAPCTIVVREARTNGAGVVTSDAQTISVPASTVTQTVTQTVTAPTTTTTPTTSTTSTTPTTSTSTTTSTTPPPTSNFQSVSYWLAWVGGNPSSVNWAGVTQADMFSLATCTNTVTSNCPTPASLDSSFNGVPTGSALTSWVSAVHAAHRQAIITIGGSTNPDWAYPCDPAHVSAFAQNLVNYAISNGFDGVDLDIEQDASTGSPTFTASMLQACTQDVSQDAKSAVTAAGKTPLVTSDVDPTTSFDIGQIQQPYIDQFNAMSYGATGSALQQQITNLHNNSGIPYAKITAGIDVTGTHDCPGAASYANSNGLAGVMTWYLQASQEGACLTAIQPYVGAP